MERHFHTELHNLKQILLKMGFLVDQAIEKAVDSFLERNHKLADQVLEDEKGINSLEVEIDEKGHLLLALSQPVAADFRSVTMILKMNTDLERMGDHAVNIAERALRVIEDLPLDSEDRLRKMAGLVQDILKDALDCFVHENVELARSVLKRDDEIDFYNDSLSAQVAAFMQKKPSAVHTGINVMIVAHNLERIADLANNIAEDVVYMKEGKEVRHHLEPSN